MYATPDDPRSRGAGDPGPAGRPSPSAPATLPVILAGFLALPMSMSGAGVAVPRIGADLGAGGAAAQWVVTGYFLTASALMLVAGSLADVLGRRRVYRLGALVYAGGSLAAALAPTIEVLLAARVLTGLGAAGVMASGGALLAAAFTGPARSRAFAAMGATAGLGLALGPSAAGWMVDALGWRLGFGIFTGAGLVLLTGTLAMRESRATTRPRVDIAGASVLAVGLAGLMLAVSQGPSRGWADPLVLAAAGAGVVGLVALVPVERRAVNPVLDLALLRRRRFMGWLLAAAAMAFGYGGVLAFLPSYLQSPVGHTASSTGLIMLLPTVPMMLLPTLAARLVNRGVGPAALIATALLVLSAGNAWLSVLRPDVGIATLIGPLLTVGVGVGLAAGIIDAQAMNQIDSDHAGMAAGMLNTVRGGANALVLALFGAALVGLLTLSLGEAGLAGRVATGNIPTTGAGTLAGHLTDAWRVALLALAALCALAAVITGLLVRTTGSRTGAAGARRPVPARAGTARPGSGPGSRPADR
ncbi:MFS transporter [Streptomyces sp. CA-278952]|uniref:MFS transporter n=1 Tax=unclassified Streptomyces TaxID=2593676 RepID=UPI00236834F3|nr:MFS transporter [Streptomyces sp. CA-278952]WDG29262.1 MFS transporter [Streptomyces sp. CA-278952]